MRSAETWFQQYGVSHQNPVNKAIHWVCIPAITWSLLALLQVAPHPFPDVPLAHWATVLVLGSLVFYATLNLRILLVMGLSASALLGVNHGLEAAGAPLGWLAAGVFVLAWIAQFIGHWIEGEKPSFFEDIQFLLVGPAWLWNDLLERVLPRQQPARS